MSKRRQLSKKQLAVLEDLFGGELGEVEILKKHGISRHVYNKWLAEELFFEQFRGHLAGVRLQSELLIARYTAAATVKLIELTESEKPEVARRACLDIISQPGKNERVRPAEKRQEKTTEGPRPKLSKDQAGKILAVLAGDVK